MVEGTPVLDIKPYIPYDSIQLEDREHREQRNHGKNTENVGNVGNKIDKGDEIIGNTDIVGNDIDIKKEKGGRNVKEGKEGKTGEEIEEYSLPLPMSAIRSDGSIYKARRLKVPAWIVDR